MPQSKSLKPEKKILSKASTGYGDIIKKYNKSFHKFLARNLNRSLMGSMIYSVSINGTKGIGYDSDDEFDSEKYDKQNTLHSYFVSSRKQNDVRPKGRIIYKPKSKTKPHARFNYS